MDLDRITSLKGLIYMTITLSLGFLLVGINLSYLAFIPLLFLFFFRGTAHPMLKNYIKPSIKYMPQERLTKALTG